VPATVLPTPGLAHHFDDLEQQHEAGTLGMWAFLATEVLFFGGMFTVYAVYRFQYPDAFARASHHLDVTLGGINTAVLIGSSLSMALAVRSAQLGRSGAIIGWLAVTFLLGSVFLGIKLEEYTDKWEHHLIPGVNFVFDGHPGGHEQLFYALYFALTGMHALHMIIGMALMVLLMVQASKHRFTAQHHPLVENFGLYWHFVDIVWIFLFPLLYLIGAHQ
jgi:cytochrome c oxidase subunit 3